ncbi:hypothetical protein BS17DRAFT_766774 [Gyrodon lividus]|nr:hypothetical protein BS17DRAFT_766774 [Gyrodon lividus]
MPSRKKPLPSPTLGSVLGQRLTEQEWCPIWFVQLEEAETVSEDELGAGQRKRTRTSKLATNPMLIGFYPAQCKKVLSIAKVKPFPFQENHVDYCRELVSEALVQFRDANYNVEEGYWPDYKYPMGKLRNPENGLTHC